jgi:hypothetical protein
VVIDDLDVVGIPAVPPETHPPPVIDPDTVLSLPVACQRFEAIARRGLEVAQGARTVEVVQLPAGHSLDRGEATDRAVLEEGAGFLGREGSDHGKTI